MHAHPYPGLIAAGNISWLYTLWRWPGDFLGQWCVTDMTEAVVWSMLVWLDKLSWISAVSMRRSSPIDLLPLQTGPRMNKCRAELPSQIHRFESQRNISWSADIQEINAYCCMPLNACVCYTAVADWYTCCQSESLVSQSCSTLGDPMDSSPPGSSAHVIFQARILEWVAIFLSRVSSQPRDQTQVS